MCFLRLDISSWYHTEDFSTPGEYSMKYVLSSKPVGGVQQRGLGLLELELQVVVGCPI